MITTPENFIDTIKGRMDEAFLNMSLRIKQDIIDELSQENAVLREMLRQLGGFDVDTPRNN